MSGRKMSGRMMLRGRLSMEHLTAILAGLADRAAQLSGEVPPGEARPLPLSLYTGRHTANAAE